MRIFSFLCFCLILFRASASAGVLRQQFATAIHSSTRARFTGNWRRQPASTIRWQSSVNQVWDSSNVIFRTRKSQPEPARASESLAIQPNLEWKQWGCAAAVWKGGAQTVADLAPTAHDDTFTLAEEARDTAQAARLAGDAAVSGYPEEITAEWIAAASEWESAAALIEEAASTGWTDAATLATASAAMATKRAATAAAAIAGGKERQIAKDAVLAWKDAADDWAIAAANCNEDSCDADAGSAIPGSGRRPAWELSARNSLEVMGLLVVTLVGLLSFLGSVVAVTVLSTMRCYRFDALLVDSEPLLFAHA